MLFRSVLFNVAAYCNFLVQSVLFLPTLLLPERQFWIIVRFWVRSTLWLHRRIIGTTDEIGGRENIPLGACIVASKHQSAWETLRLVDLLPRPAFILKRELLWVPLFGWYLTKAGMIPVDRGKRSLALEAMIGRARRALEQGWQIVIFPEGTRTPPGAVPDYRYGVTRLYLELNVPCVPVALNSGLFWKRRSITQARGTILLSFLQPIEPGLSGNDFADVLQQSIETATGRLIKVSQDPLRSGDVPPSR